MKRLGFFTFLALAITTLSAAAQYNCQPANNASDPTQNFCTVPNFPKYGTGSTSGVPNNPLPQNQSAVPGNGLTLVSGASNAFSLLMGATTPNANITTSAAVRDFFFMNYIVGNLQQTIGCPMDTAQGCGNSPFYAVARHYNAGDANDLHVITNAGLQLRAICSGSDHGNCSQGNIYGGMIRVPFEIRPGMTIKVRYQTPPGKHSWAPIWMVSGSEVSPGPYTSTYTPNPYSFPIQYPTSKKTYEIDNNDNFARWYNNPSVPVGYQLDFGVPNIYGVPFTNPPAVVYANNSNGYTYYNVPAPFFKLPNSWNPGFHNLVLSWNASEGMLYVYTDGILTVKESLDYSYAPTYTDPADGQVKQQAMHLLIGNQAVPTFDPDVQGGSGIQPPVTIVENDGMPNPSNQGWTINVQEISVWNGILTSAQ